MNKRDQYIKVLKSRMVKKACRQLLSKRGAWNLRRPPYIGMELARFIVEGNEKGKSLGETTLYLIRLSRKGIDRGYEGRLRQDVDRLMKLREKYSDDKIVDMAYSVLP